ncbi:unnamed protein product [Brassica rapa subsp. trilocularis]
MKSSTAGAPIAGSAVEQVEQVVGYVSLGYPFGLLAPVLFGRHHKAIFSSPKPKLFVMGTRDGFTSVSQLRKKLKSAAGRTSLKELAISRWKDLNMILRWPMPYATLFHPCKRSHYAT